MDKEKKKSGLSVIIGLGKKGPAADPEGLEEPAEDQEDLDQAEDLIAAIAEEDHAQVLAILKSLIAKLTD